MDRPIPSRGHSKKAKQTGGLREDRHQSRPPGRFETGCAGDESRLSAALHFAAHRQHEG